MSAGVTDRLWEISDMVGLLEQYEAKSEDKRSTHWSPLARGTNKLGGDGRIDLWGIGRRSFDWAVCVRLPCPDEIRIILRHNQTHYPGLMKR